MEIDFSKFTIETIHVRGPIGDKLYVGVFQLVGSVPEELEAETEKEEEEETHRSYANRVPAGTVHPQLVSMLELCEAGHTYAAIAENLDITQSVVTYWVGKVKKAGGLKEFLKERGITAATVSELNKSLSSGNPIIPLKPASEVSAADTGGVSQSNG